MSTTDSTKPAGGWAARLRENLLSHLGRRLLGLAVAALALAGFHALGWLTATFDALGRGQLVAADRAYLTQSAEQAGDAFLTLSSLQGGLHLVQSGSAGISFIVDLQARVGDLLTPLVKMVDRAAELSLAGMAANDALGVLLQAAEVVAAPLLGAVLLLLALHALARLVTLQGNRLSRFSGESAELLLVVFLTLYLALPLAVWGASQLSQAFTAPLAAEAHGHFTTLNDHLNAGGRGGDLKGTVHGVIDRYETFSSKLPEKLHLAGEALKRHLVIFALDVVVFPLGLLWLLYLVARVIARHLLGPLHAVERAAEDEGVR
ncbi:hypothetical protein [Endothiovibrio diazotrophicus]